jgi:diadenosine tetraphosphatase ApaH/serine/threonine PP2A family protein phosphatase
MLTDEEHAWILDLPWAIEEDAFIAVHAGLTHGKTIAEHLSDPQMARNLLDIRTIEWHDGSIVPWHQAYSSTKKIVYGHWAAQGLSIGKNAVGLDTGCVYGKQLTAYILETDEIVSVPAKRVYQAIE